jgi:hypothetical protein
MVIDALCGMVHRVAGHSARSDAHFVDVRDPLPREHWADEIHGTSQGSPRSKSCSGQCCARWECRRRGA